MFRNTFLIIIIVTFLSSCAVCPSGRVYVAGKCLLKEDVGHLCEWSEWKTWTKNKSDVQLVSTKFSNVVEKNHTLYGDLTVILRANSVKVGSTWRECLYNGKQIDHEKKDINISEPSTVPSREISLIGLNDNGIYEHDFIAELTGDVDKEGYSIYKGVYKVKIPNVKISFKETKGAVAFGIRTVWETYNHPTARSQSKYQESSWECYISPYVSPEELLAKKQGEAEAQRKIEQARIEKEKAEQSKRQAKFDQEAYNREQEQKARERQSRNSDNCDSSDNPDQCWFNRMSNDMACGDPGTIQRLHGEINRGWISRTPKSGPGWKHMSMKQTVCNVKGQTQIKVHTSPLEWWVLGYEYRQ